VTAQHSLNNTRDLQIDEDLRFQRHEWQAQRLGRALLSLLVVAALLGLTGGGGPLSQAEATEPGGAIAIDYQRFVRRGARSTIVVRLRTAPGQARLWISDEYLRQVRVEAISPEPDSVSVEQRRHVYTFKTDSPDVTVALELEHSTSGRLHADIGVAGGPGVGFQQLAFF
jgi:hypothetical protein